MRKTYYITTPIYYPNAKPHLGTAYTTIAADILARWHKLLGKEVFFLTGTDEHAKKVYLTAKKQNQDPKEYVDSLAREFKESWEKLDIKYDRFIKTTEKDHKDFVEHILTKTYKKGDIYKGTYEGYYCEGCAAYYTEKDLENGSCPTHKTKAEKLKEECYFFKLSKYQNELLKLYEKNPGFILPETRRNEIINRVKEGLRDLSISRKDYGWGIKLPFDKTHVCYVWYDALTNYVSGINYLKDKKQFNKFWPADVHLVGKDILWFHSVIWPAMLISVGIEPPKSVFAHGWWTVDKEKIAKSRGNAIDPLEIAKEYSSDSLRYFLFREISFGDDGDFSEEALKARHNGELANELGNLLNRIVVLAEKKLNSTIKKDKSDSELFKSLNIKKISKHMDSYELHKALEEIFKFVQECNRYTNAKEPWKSEDKSQVNAVLYNLADAMRMISILLSPFMPQTSEKINSQLNVKAGKIKDCRHGLLKTTKIKKGEILFPRIQ